MHLSNHRVITLSRLTSLVVALAALSNLTTTASAGIVSFVQRGRFVTSLEGLSEQEKSLAREAYARACSRGLSTAPETVYEPISPGSTPPKDPKIHKGWEIINGNLTIYVSFKDAVYGCLSSPRQFRIETAMNPEDFSLLTISGTKIDLQPDADSNTLFFETSEPFRLISLKRQRVSLWLKDLDELAQCRFKIDNGILVRNEADLLLVEEDS